MSAGLRAETDTGMGVLPRRIHLVGIGGIGISAIARVLAMEGHALSGSDMRASPITQALQQLGIVVYIGHDSANLADAELVVASSAIPEDNPEIVAARRGGVPVLKRQQFLPRLLSGRRTVAVAGTHGKTTTTAMIAAILRSAGLEPGFIVGGIVPDLGTNGAAGRGDWFVIEADEYDRMFQGLTPHIAVLTSLDMDHPDCFRDIDDLREAFQVFLRQVNPQGMIVACTDNDNVRRVVEDSAPAARVVTYGQQANADYRVVVDGVNAVGGPRFAIVSAGGHPLALELMVPGIHNALNAAAATIVARACGAQDDIITTTLQAYRGAERRFEIKCEASGITVVDDYAHHPTEIKATLAAARLRYRGRRVVAVFQPHTYSRLTSLFDAFATCFGDADLVRVLDVYAARAHERGGRTAQDLVAAIGDRAAYAGAPLDAAASLMPALVPGDVLITLSAGDGNLVGERVCAMLRREA